MFNYWFLTFVFFLLNQQLNYVNSQMDIGDQCTVISSRATGICKLITQCPVAIADIKRGQKPTVCGYQKLAQIVCCANPPTSKPTSSPIPPALLNTKRALKCVEYSKAVYETKTGTTIDGISFKKEVDGCGHIALPLIVGGTPAGPREFPHSALLGYETPEGKILWSCGGALLSPKYVITAGHCLNSRDNGNVKFCKLGDLNIASETDDARPKTMEVEEIIPHPLYKSSSQYNDIALLKLKGELTLNPYIRPICLPVVPPTTNTKAVATGWGNVEWAGENSNALLKVTLDLFTHQECNESYKFNINRKLPFGIVDETQLCAGSKTSAKDTCQGDSGGPLQIYHPSLYCMYTLFGVTSFGRACGTANVPGVYTRVSAYVDWIESVVWK